MPSKVTSDFKAAFALLLSIMKITYGVDPALNYSATVYEWTMAGLITEGIIELKFHDDAWVISDSPGSGKSYAPQFKAAEERYKEAVGLINNPVNVSTKAWVQSQILTKCFEVNRLIFPIALKEGLLDLKDIAAGIGAGVSGIPMEKDR